MSPQQKRQKEKVQNDRKKKIRTRPTADDDDGLIGGIFSKSKNVQRRRGNGGLRFFFLPITGSSFLSFRFSFVLAAASAASDFMSDKIQTDEI